VRIIRGVLGVALLAAMAVPAAAQNNFRFDNGNTGRTGWGAYVGWYSGTLLSVPGQPTVDIFCVDYLHTVTTGNQWQAAFSNLSGDLSDTYAFARWGDQSIARERYSWAAWLATQAQPTNPGQWSAIHGAVWNLMSGGTASYAGSPVGGVPGDGSASQGWLLSVQGAFQSDPNAINPSEWTVISDVAGTKQEFMMQQSVVPEPETVILLVTGLLAIGAVAYFRGFSA
jgi:hypothetical protein